MRCPPNYIKTLIHQGRRQLPTAVKVGAVGAAAACLGKTVAPALLRAARPLVGLSPPMALGMAGCLAMDMGVLARQVGFVKTGNLLFYTGLAVGLAPIGALAWSGGPAMMALCVGCTAAALLFELMPHGSQLSSMSAVHLLAIASTPMGWQLLSGMAPAEILWRGGILAAGSLLTEGLIRLGWLLLYEPSHETAYGREFIVDEVSLQAQRLDLGDPSLSPSLTQLPPGIADCVRELSQPGLKGERHRLDSRVLVGPAGSGKTSVAFGIAQALGGMLMVPRFGRLAADDIKGTSLAYLNLGTAILQAADLAAAQNRPLVVLLEDVETLCPRAELGHQTTTAGLSDSILVELLCTALKKLKKMGRAPILLGTSRYSTSYGKPLFGPGVKRLDVQRLHGDDLPQATKRPQQLPTTTRIIDWSSLLGDVRRFVIKLTLLDPVAAQRVEYAFRRYFTTLGLPSIDGAEALSEFYQQLAGD